MFLMVLKYMHLISNEEKLYQAMLWCVLEFMEGIWPLFVLFSLLNPIRLMNNWFEFDIPCRRKIILSFTWGNQMIEPENLGWPVAIGTTPIGSKFFK